MIRPETGKADLPGNEFSNYVVTRFTCPDFRGIYPDNGGIGLFLKTPIPPSDGTRESADYKKIRSRKTVVRIQLHFSGSNDFGIPIIRLYNGGRTGRSRTFPKWI
jgi:hypothetical protein